MPFSYNKGQWVKKYDFTNLKNDKSLGDQNKHLVNLLIDQFYLLIYLEGLWFIIERCSTVLGKFWDIHLCTITCKPQPQNHNIYIERTFNSVQNGINKSENLFFKSYAR